MKAIYKSGSLYPVPVMEKPTMNFWGGFNQSDLDEVQKKEEAYTAYLSTVIIVPVEHQKEFVEGREYEEGVDYRIEKQVAIMENNKISWVSSDGFELTYKRAGDSARRKVALPISKREEVEEIKHFVWQKEKPQQFTDECLLLIAKKWKDEPFEYDLFEIREIDGYNENDEPAWYWGIFCPDGEEWGDYADLKADLYMTMPVLESLTPLSQNTPSTGAKR